MQSVPITITKVSSIPAHARCIRYNIMRQVGVVLSGYSVSSTNKTDRDDIIEKLLKVMLNTINLA